ncbi:radical SAM protein [Streptomyces violascens]|uniref:radical SAM protein n=1 Tax=Streptomyces violascens TaxID=67381 RepID=UPI00365FC1ED
MTIAPEAPAKPAVPTFLELEITQRCQLTCGAHCYAEAGPSKGHGSMAADDWKRVISEAAVIGVKKVQLIGGEPTLHPDFTELVEHALTLDLDVQIYSNLYKVRLAHWDLFTRPGVSLATSYYADTDDGHDAVTGREGSHAATRANIIEALRRGIRLQVGIVDVLDGQRVEEARAELDALGVTDVHIDRVRAVGNAAVSIPSASSLCGNCAQNVAAIMPDGSVTPCVLGRFLPAGSVKEEGLTGIFGGEKWARIKQLIPPLRERSCTPNEDSCGPSPLAPTACGPDCQPAHSDSCDPAKGTPCGPMGIAPATTARMPKSS